MRLHRAVLSEAAVAPIRQLPQRAGKGEGAVRDVRQGGAQGVLKDAPPQDASRPQGGALWGYLYVLIDFSSKL